MHVHETICYSEKMTTLISSISVHSPSAISVRYIMDRIKNDVLNTDIALHMETVHFG